jgi:hypothetical protein
VRQGDPVLIASLLFDLVEAASRWLIHGDGRRFDGDAALAEAVDAVCRSVQAQGAEALPSSRASSAGGGGTGEARPPQSTR